VPPPVGGDGPHAYKILLRSRPEEAKSQNKKENHQSFRDVQIEKDEEATKTMKLVKQPRIQFPGDLIANCGLSAQKFCEGNTTATQ
jgi:hypothetical protein